MLELCMDNEKLLAGLHCDSVRLQRIEVSLHCSFRNQRSWSNSEFNGSLVTDDTVTSPANTHVLGAELHRNDPASIKAKSNIQPNISILCSSPINNKSFMFLHHHFNLQIGVKNSPCCRRNKKYYGSCKTAELMYVSIKPYIHISLLKLCFCQALCLLIFFFLYAFKCHVQSQRTR